MIRGAILGRDCMALECKRLYKDTKRQERKTEKDAWEKNVKLVLHTSDPFIKLHKEQMMNAPGSQDEEDEKKSDVEISPEKDSSICTKCKSVAPKNAKKAWQIKGPVKLRMLTLATSVNKGASLKASEDYYNAEEKEETYKDIDQKD